MLGKCLGDCLAHNEYAISVTGFIISISFFLCFLTVGATPCPPQAERLSLIAYSQLSA